MSNSNSNEPSRRDFIYIATAAAGAITTTAAVWPLIDQHGIAPACWTTRRHGLRRMRSNQAA